jgi:hypothetical protein
MIFHYPNQHCSKVEETKPDSGEEHCTTEHLPFESLPCLN